MRKGTFLFLFLISLLLSGCMQGGQQETGKDKGKGVSKQQNEQGEVNEVKQEKESGSGEKLVEKNEEGIKETEQSEKEIENGESAEKDSSFSCGEDITITVDGTEYTYSTKLMDDGKCWTTDNMRHGTKLSSADDTPSDDNTIEKWCYDNDSTYCENQGGLYSWKEAMGWGSNENENISKSVCGQLGDNWRMPTDSEWHQLEEAYKNDGVSCDGSRDGERDCNGAGWDGNKLGGLGFSLPGNRSTDGSSYFSQGSSGSRWSSTEDGSTAYYRTLFYGNSDVTRLSNFKVGGFSVVCLQD